MSLKVRIPQPLQKLTLGKDLVEVSGLNVQSMLDDLEKQFPGIKARICDETGKLRRFINIYVNEEDVRFLKGDETELKDGDEISIIPAIAGGQS